MLNVYIGSIILLLVYGDYCRVDNSSFVVGVPKVFYLCILEFQDRNNFHIFINEKASFIVQCIY